MKKSSLVIIILIFSLFSVSCLTENLKMPFHTYTPSNLGDGWTISQPANERIDGEALKDVYKYVHEDDNIWQIRSLLVFRNGNLVAESYMKDDGDRTNLRPIWSCTKQVTGILAGIAIEKNYFTLSDTLSDHLSQISSTQHGEKSMITIENLLMMKSGINWNNSGIDGQSLELLREKPSNSIDYVLGLGMHSTPGIEFKYKDGDPHLISAIIQERTGKTMRDWATEVLFSKIGITRLQWITYKDGITMGAFGILTTPRELAKIGQLVLNEGMWNGEQIVNAVWIGEMTQPKVSASETQNENITFGYMWWRDIKRNVMFTWGHGGQFVFINKDKNLIVVITSEPRTQDKWEVSVYEALSIYDRVNDITSD